MIGRDETFAVKLEKLRDDAGDTFVHRFDRFDSGCQYSGVPDHVRIGKVKNNQIVICHSREHFIGYFACAHFRLKIVGSDLRRRNDFSIFTRERLLDSAVKKIGHMRIFFRLGDAQLRFAGRAHDLAQNVRAVPAEQK